MSPVNVLATLARVILGSSGPSLQGFSSQVLMANRALAVFMAATLPVLAHPGVLPGRREAHVVAAEARIGPVRETELDGLARGQRNRRGHADTRVLLQRVRVLDAAHRGLPAIPEVAVERYPQAR